MPLFLYHIEPSREAMPLAPTEVEQRLVAEHFAWLAAGYSSGGIKYVGRTTSAPFLGLALFDAQDQAAADAFVAADPAVKAGVFIGRAQPFSEVFPMR